MARQILEESRIHPAIRDRIPALGADIVKGVLVGGGLKKRPA